MSGPQRRSGGAGSDRRGRDDRRGSAAEKSTYIERVVKINRVAKVVKDGHRFSFTALDVIGDGDGSIGVGYGKAKEVPAAITKGVEEAKKSIFTGAPQPGHGPAPVKGEKAAGVVLLRPATPGTGVIAGGPVRAVLECAGIHDMLSRVARLGDPLDIVVRPLQPFGLQPALRRWPRVAASPIEDVAPAALLRAQAGQGRY